MILSVTAHRLNISPFTSKDLYIKDLYIGAYELEPNVAKEREANIILFI